MSAVMLRRWRTASVTSPVPASPLERISAAPSEMRRSAGSSGYLAGHRQAEVRVDLCLRWILCRSHAHGLGKLVDERHAPSLTDESRAVGEPLEICGRDAHAFGRRAGFEGGGSRRENVGEKIQES